MSGYTLLIGDALEQLRTLPSDSVSMCCCSPPYYGLRSYLPIDHPDKVMEIGNEYTPDQYVARLVEVFREVRRILHPTGVLFLNLGDSYAVSGGKGLMYGSTFNGNGLPQVRPPKVDNIKPKDLIGIPWMVAFALRADGWWLRSAITWCKGNPMPESVTDRPTSATEMVFMLAKSERYYYDQEAIREPLATPIHKPGNKWHPDKVSGPNDRNGHSQWDDTTTRAWGNESGRNKRNWWLVNSEPYPGSHYATMPSKLVEPCVLAGSSAYGVCSAKKTMLKLRDDLSEWQREISTAYLRDRNRVDRTLTGGARWDTGEIPAELREYFEEVEVTCGSPWQRLVEEERTNYISRPDRQVATGGAINGGVGKNFPDTKRTTVGWAATCTCQADVVPATVLDCFAGSGTTLAVALKFGRRAIGIDLDPRNAILVRQRIEQTQPLLLSEVTQ